MRNFCLWLVLLWAPWAAPVASQDVQGLLDMAAARTTTRLVSGPGLAMSAEYQPYEPIVVGCECVVPDGAEVRYMWRISPAAHLEQGATESVAHIWAPPGAHWVDTTVVAQVYRTITVLIPDPDNPKDIEKAKLQQVKILESFDVQRYERRFRVAGGPQPDPDNPQPDPDNPDPLDGFAGQCRKWMQAVPGYSKDSALKIADNYATVASQGSDPARSQGWDLSAFVAATKDRNHQTLGTEAIANWTEFFRALATYQANLAKERGIGTKDRAKLAELWDETAKAVRAAAY